MASNCSKKPSVPCYCHDKKFEDYLDLKAAVFPNGYDYRVCYYVSHGDGKFEVKLRVQMSTKREMLLWIENFKKSSAVPFINTKTHPCSDDPLPGHSIYKADWKCHMNTNSNDTKSSDPKHPSKKCRSIMHTSLRKARLMTPHESRFDHHELEGFMGVVSLRHFHNHRLLPIALLPGLNPPKDLTISRITQPTEKCEPLEEGISFTDQFPTSSQTKENPSATVGKEVTNSSAQSVPAIARKKDQNEPGTSDPNKRQSLPLVSDAVSSTTSAKRKHFLPSSQVIPKKALKKMPPQGVTFELVSSEPGDVQVIPQNVITKKTASKQSKKNEKKMTHQKQILLYVASSTREYLDGLFRLGYEASTAHIELREDLKTNYGENFEKVINDRGFHPGYPSCKQLYLEYKSKNGAVKESDHHSILEKLIADFNNRTMFKSANFELVGDNNYAVAVLSPLMRQVSRTWPRAKEEVLLTRCGNLNEDLKNNLFLFLTPSPAGALPVGAFIASSLHAKVISKGVELYFGLLDEKCFGGNGLHGPRVLLTDDSLLLIKLMNSTFPTSSVFLADRFIVDSCWKWIWGGDSPVPKESKSRLMIALEDVFNSSNYIEMDRKLSAFFNDKDMRGCELFKNFCDMLNSKKQHFAISYGTVINGSKEHTSHENSFSVINDLITQNSKLTNITTTTHFAIVRLSAHFYKRISDALNWKPGLFKRNYLPRTPRFRDVTQDMVIKLTESEFIVKSFSTEGVEYHCNTELGRCCCFVGWRGCPCKHLAAVAEFYPGATPDHYHPVLSQQEMMSFYNCLMDPVLPSSTSEGEMSLTNGSNSELISDEVYEEKCVVILPN